MLIAIVLGLIAWVLVSAAIVSPVGRRLARCAPPDPDACWGCDCAGYGPGVAHTCGRRAGEWTESRTRGGRP